MRRYTLLIVTLLGALLLAACGQSLPTAEQIVEQMEQARADTQSAHATVALTFRAQERSGSIVVEGWTQRAEVDGQPISRMRAEVREASEAELVGTVAVSDGEQFWLYSPAENTVVTGAAEEMKDATAGTPAGAATALTDLVGQGLDALDLTVVGREQVAGKDTWRVEFTPKAETSAQLQLDGIVNGTMWVDEQLALPLKVDLDASDLGAGTVEVRSIERNIQLSPDLFTFTAPAGAEVVQAQDLAAAAQPRAATVAEARETVGFRLKEPGYLPANTALVEVRVIGASTVILNYAGEGGSVSVVQSNEEVGRDREPPAGSQVQDVQVAGVPATLITGGDGQGSLLRWEQDGVRYVVAGTLSGAEALLVAEGLK